MSMHAQTDFCLPKCCPPSSKILAPPQRSNATEYAFKISLIQKMFCNFKWLVLHCLAISMSNVSKQDTSKHHTQKGRLHRTIVENAATGNLAFLIVPIILYVLINND